MNTTNTIVIDSPVGKLKLTAAEGQLTHCIWTTQAVSSKNSSPLLQDAVQQLQEYFKGKRKCFELPLAPKGTPFQEAVWQALLEIPYGETCSYQQLAGNVGRAKAFRAAGTANGKNPICIIIPCHRVIRATGELGGYGGTVPIKKQLLDLESGKRGY